MLDDRADEEDTRVAASKASLMEPTLGEGDGEGDETAAME